MSNRQRKNMSSLCSFWKT